MSILNAKRLRDYPRLMLISTWVILGINILLHQGWIGAFGQVIGGDFVMFYSTGLIYRSNPGLIYDYASQTQLQQGLVSPTILPGYNPYMNPPFMAPLYSLLTYIPLSIALLIWSILAILAVFLAIYWLYQLHSLNAKTPTFPYGQMMIIALSFFPFLEGLQAGQNHWLTLLLVSGIIYSMFTNKWYLAGALAGILIYKPQFVLGFLILWLIWKNWKALFSFGIIAGLWAGLFALVNGLNLYKTFLLLSSAFMNLPYIAGFPNYLLVTFYGLLTSIFPATSQPVLAVITQVLMIIYAAGLAWFAYKLRKAEPLERIPVIVAALLFPLLVTPYALLHDLVILIPAYILWTFYSNSRQLLYTSVAFYLGAFLLTLIAALTRFAWVSLLVLGLFIALLARIFSRPNPSYETGRPT